MSSLRLIRGPMLILLYQVAPIAARQDSLGRFRVSVGFSAGQWEHEEFGCNGSLISSTPVRYRSGGARFEAWPDRQLRLTAFGGGLSQSIGPTHQADGSTTPAFVPRYNGPFGGAGVAYEGRSIGIGLGLVRVSGPNGFTAPAPYLRFGNIDKIHFRFDVLASDPEFPTTGWGRVGVGFNEGHLPGTGGFVGLGMSPVDYNNKVGLTGDVRFPIGHRLDGQVQGFLGPGENVAQWSTGVGLRYSFGAP